MYDEQNRPLNHNGSAGENGAADTPKNEPYRWSTPAPESGAYHTAGGQKESIPASTPQAGQSAQPRQAPPASQPYTAQPQQNAPFHGGGNGNGFHGNGNGGNGSGGPRRRKKGGAGKYIAVALVCALCGGLVGGIFGGGIGQYLFRASTTVHVSDRTVSDVKEVKVDGQTEMSNAENYAANVNSVVSINVGTETNFFGRIVEQASSGSGFILTSDGYILTNYHVVDGASTIEVTTYAGDTFEAKYIGGDEDYDIAVIKVDVTGLSPVTIGDSDEVHVGDNVIAIGNPLGELTFSLTSGSVSAANRAITVEDTPFNMIQVDCSINPGNSGGPLLNSYGEVIGIVSAKYSTYGDTTVEGLGFAIPINDVYAMVQDIMENGYVTDKASLGIYGTSVTQQLQMQYNLPVSGGVYVFSVEPDGTAAASGLRAGDIIVKLGDKEITSMSDLVSAKKGYRAGDTETMVVNRSGEEVTIDFTFDSEPQDTNDASTTATPDDSRNDDSYSYGYGYDPYSFFDWIA